MHRPRASATADIITGMVRCMTSASPDTAVRRQSQVPTPATYTSVSMGSPRKATETVRSVFSCVASRNRMVSLGTPTGPFGQEIGTGSAGREKKGRLFAVQPPTKVRPCAHPLEALQNPGWSAQRHRRGRATLRVAKSSTRDSPPFSAQCRLEEAGGSDASPSAEGRCRSAHENWASL